MDNVEDMWCFFKEIIMKVAEDVWHKKVKKEGAGRGGCMQWNKDVKNAVENKRTENMVSADECARGSLGHDETGV